MTSSLAATSIIIDRCTTWNRETGKTDETRATQSSIGLPHSQQQRTIRKKPHHTQLVLLAFKIRRNRSHHSCSFHRNDSSLLLHPSWWYLCCRVVPGCIQDDLLVFIFPFDNLWIFFVFLIAMETFDWLYPVNLSYIPSLLSCNSITRYCHWLNTEFNKELLFIQ